MDYPPLRLSAEIALDSNRRVKDALVRIERIGPFYPYDKHKTMLDDASKRVVERAVAYFDEITNLYIALDQIEKERKPKCRN